MNFIILYYSDSSDLLKWGSVEGEEQLISYLLWMNNISCESLTEEVDEPMVSQLAG